MGSIVWFRRDLRIGDNPAWNAATAAGDRIMPLFILDPALYRTAGPHRGPQLVAHLTALDHELKQLGGRLHVAHGRPKEILGGLTQEGQAVFANRDYSPYAMRRDSAATASGLDVRWHDGTYVIPPGSVTTAEGKPYQVFSAFHRRWQEAPWPGWPEPSKTQEIASSAGDGIPQAASALLDGGERAARDRLNDFLELVDEYPDLRNRPDLDSTSRLSADLKFGTLSPRRVIDEIGTGTAGRQAFVRQIAWREFYAQLIQAFPHTVARALRPQYDRISWRSDAEDLHAWEAGRTGYPIVDAGMRQLASEGWMHNRVRMITASFLVKDLLIDWRAGEKHFRRLLLDAEPAQNVGNWQWVAGTGADAAPYFRVFNPITQSTKFDPDGRYIRRYVPELADVPTKHIHAPWKAPGLELAEAGVTLGSTYPFPIVDHSEARQRTLAAYEAARAGE